MASSRDAPVQARLLQKVWTLNLTFLWGSSPPPYTTPTSVTSVPGQALAALCLHNQPGGTGIAFRLYNLIISSKPMVRWRCWQPSVQSTPSGIAHSVAERERSMGSSWLCQAALTPSAEIPGWHLETAQQEPQHSASESQEGSKACRAAFGELPCQSGMEKLRPLPGLPPHSLDISQPWLCSHHACSPQS